MIFLMDALVSCVRAPGQNGWQNFGQDMTLLESYGEWASEHSPEIHSNRNEIIRNLRRASNVGIYSEIFLCRDFDGNIHQRFRSSCYLFTFVQQQLSQIRAHYFVCCGRECGDDYFS